MNEKQLVTILDSLIYTDISEDSLYEITKELVKRLE